MATIDTIKQMKQMGYADGDIITNLQSQGISPREINDAFSQLKIKDAITTGGISGAEAEGIVGGIPSEFQGMQPSEAMTQEQPSIPSAESYQETVPAPGQEIQPAQYYPPQTQQDQAYYDQYGYDAQAGAGEAAYGGEYQQYGIDTETVNEIADQLITEKLVKTNTDLKALTEFKIILDSKVQKIDERLQRIESIIDQLQASIMRKSLDQSQSIEDIKNEIQMTQSNFSKILNPLTDNIRQMERMVGKKSQSSEQTSYVPESSKKTAKSSRR